MKLLLRLGDGLAEFRQADLVVGFVAGASLVFVLAEMLDLFTRVLNFGEAEGCGAAFEEVAERGELGEVFLFAAKRRKVSRCERRKVKGVGDMSMWWNGVREDECGVRWGKEKYVRLQKTIHLAECALGLGEEVVDNALGKLPLLLVVVHLKDLLKCGRVNRVACAGNRHDVFVLKE